jgi:hypothetical protein
MHPGYAWADAGEATAPSGNPDDYKAGGKYDGVRDRTRTALELSSSPFALSAPLWITVP